ncbi:pyridoxamine 5'-phosphate oxidase family protein [Streptomyces bohaiensis]|uniref:pyridoxamine 5'-phosphate oxidase family protein n=1 Tax=Streptomyces bohaiensis TaxID=1431344 RepID=UPI0030C75AD0
MAEIDGPGHGPGRTSGNPAEEEPVEAPTGDRDRDDWHPPAAAAAAHRPGNAGQWSVQARLGTTEAARRFHAEQVVDRLNRRMLQFVARQEMFFLATSDRFGECHSTLRAGPPGFLHALDDRTLVYPEYRGSGVHASLGNIAENPHAGLLLLDFERARIGLHVNGRAHLLGEDEFRERHPEVPTDPLPGRRARLWVRIDVITAHIHGATHIPHLVGVPKRSPREWGSQDYRRKGGDFFGVARARATADGPPAVPPRPADAAGGAAGVPSAEPHPADPPPDAEPAAEHDRGTSPTPEPSPEVHAPEPHAPAAVPEVTYVTPLRLDDPAPPASVPAAAPPLPEPRQPETAGTRATESTAARTVPPRDVTGRGEPGDRPTGPPGAPSAGVDTAERPPGNRPSGDGRSTAAARTTAALQALREQAERRLAEAERRARSSGGGGGWFGES